MGAQKRQAPPSLWHPPLLIGSPLFRRSAANTKWNVREGGSVFAVDGRCVDPQRGTSVEHPSLPWDWFSLPFSKSNAAVSSERCAWGKAKAHFLFSHSGIFTHGWRGAGRRARDATEEPLLWSFAEVRWCVGRRNLMIMWWMCEVRTCKENNSFSPDWCVRVRVCVCVCVSVCVWRGVLRALRGSRLVDHSEAWTELSQGCNSSSEKYAQTINILCSLDTDLWVVRRTFVFWDIFTLIWKVKQGVKAPCLSFVSLEIEFKCGRAVNHRDPNVRLWRPFWQMTCCE